MFFDSRVKKGVISVRLLHHILELTVGCSTLHDNLDSSLHGRFKWIQQY